MNRVGFPCVFTVGRVLALCTVFWLAGVQSVGAVAEGEWVNTVPSAPGVYGSLVVLSNGTPLLFDHDIGATPAGQVQRYDPATGTWILKRPFEARRLPMLAVLPSDLVLVAGGTSLLTAGGLGPPFRSAEIYNPTTGTSTATTGNMNFARGSGGQATALASGKVLISGGLGGASNNQFIALTEIYDPRTGLFSLSGVMNHPRTGHAAVRLADGKVLVAGGSGAGRVPLDVENRRAFFRKPGRRFTVARV